VVNTIAMLASEPVYGYFSNVDGMHSWAMQYKLGSRLLARHEPGAAIGALRKAAEGCPARRRRELARILYYLGLALERTGRGDLAVMSWVNARKLVRSGAIERAYGRWVNDYGMRRRPTREGDDFAAFKSIQMARYLSKSGSKRFSSRAERDAVNDLIGDAWETLRDRLDLEHLSCTRKLELFRRATVDLPFLCVEDALDSYREPVVGNFRFSKVRSARLSSEDRCTCGSGLPFRACCGRLRSCVELESGSL
jgi:hypothetical protein